jgi:hypothetical protein
MSMLCEPAGPPGVPPICVIFPAITRTSEKIRSAPGIFSAFISSSTWVARACAAVPNGLADRQLNVGALTAPVSKPACACRNVSRSSIEFSP